MSDNHPTAVWPVLTFGDARTEMAFLHEAFGLEETVVIAREDDPSIIQHGEMRWPEGPGIMFGSAGKDDSPFGSASRETSRCMSSATIPTASTLERPQRERRSSMS